MNTEDLLNYLLSEDPADVALAEAEIDRMLDSTPEINPGYQLPQKPGVVRYDSDIHTMADVSKMPHYLRQRIELAQLRNPSGRLILTQTDHFPGDSLADRSALIAVQNGQMEGPARTGATVH